ncbi:MAG: host attachment protein [Bdellovibrionia bacterium]
MNLINQLDKNDRTWILLAHRSGAKLFSSIGYGKDLKQLQEFNFPEGRLRNHDIDTDDKGRRYSSVAGRANSGGGHSPAPSHQQKGGLDRHEGAVSHIAEIFAQRLAGRLQKGRIDNEYERLILVADPRFLGLLRGCIDKETARRVVETSSHNYTDLPKNDLNEYLIKLVSGHQEAA